MNRYLIFALGLLVIVIVLAPSLDVLTGTAGGTGAGRVGGDEAVAPPVTGAFPSPRPAAPAAAPAPAAGFAGGGTTIDRDGSGQFHIEAIVNDQPLRMLVDTGADGIALSETDANAVGIRPDSSRYTQVANTASGPGYGAHVRIDRLEVAGRDLGAVDAVVVRGLGTSLLGQSVLRRVGTVTMSGDHMVIGE